MKTRDFLPVLLLLAGCSMVQAPQDTVPLIDFHQHLVSPAFAPIAGVPERDGAALLRELDAAGIGRAVVLSVAYSSSDERKGLADPDRLTREENDWTSGQVARSSGRLIGFCSANPLRDEAYREIERCLGLPGMAGIKLHLGNSGISLRNAGHLTLIQNLAGLAQARRVPLLVHMRARGGENYGPEDVRLFLEQVVTRAPDVEFVVGHLGYAGPGYPPANDEVMAAFAGLLARDRHEWRNVYFDVATNVTPETTEQEAALVAQRLRQVGLSRVLYGSDLSPPGGSIRAGWETFRGKVPLESAEFERIARNRPRFAR
jgi:predicted TIM-barrel fold metal-dependent hydrolase